MTREEILNMEAGREMDVLVAEKVMGQASFEHPGFNWTEGSTEDGLDGWSGFYCPRCGTTEGSLEKCVKHYSTDIAAAWMVVEKAVGITVENRQIYRPDEWYCEIALSDAKGYFEADATTPSLAICRAALLAVMELES